MILTGENKMTRAEICASATLSTINAIRTDLGLNLKRCHKRPTNNRLKYDTNQLFKKLILVPEIGKYKRQ